MRERFSQIYATDEWQGGSGPGSLPTHTKGYRLFLEEFLRKQSIKSVVDFGCGDWQFSRFINWQGATYQGWDVVPSVIELNRRQFASNSVDFQVFDGDYATLPSADLLLVKDVLQHWSDSAIAHFLPELRRYRYALLTNCVAPSGSTRPSDTEDGGFRHLDLRQPPFNLAADHVFTFVNVEKIWWRLWQKPKWKKFVLLVSR